ncbi:hypothetical protein NKK48_01740 [Mesorhizobium sp. C386A]|uniref:hypothetical protein n=1 Tax=unclassified Mesorhizobium TaxID=325217 RepID=UPI0003CDD755|nr:hypothetical protein [Mesorhizobium sp. LNJC386A00]ESY35799.1 hypothetical protein X748_14430 [Mesorhizobium sp. LNJC386A00]
MEKEQEHACPKCGETSGNDWSQCGGVCPIASSPHFDPTMGGRRAAPLLKQEAKEFAKATTSGRGNRKERRRMQAELMKTWRG